MKIEAIRQDLCVQKRDKSLKATMEKIRSETKKYHGDSPWSQIISRVMIEHIHELQEIIR
jgi:hypothetical protein